VITSALIFHSRTTHVLDTLDLQSFETAIAQAQHIVGTNRRIRIPGCRIRLLRFSGHRDIDVFKNLARSNAEDSVGRFDKVVTLAAAVLAAEMVFEAESGAELFGFHQEASAVGCPFGRFHGALTRGVITAVEGCSQAAFPVGATRISLREARVNVRGKWRRVNPIFLVQLRKISATEFCGSLRTKKRCEKHCQRA